MPEPNFELIANVASGPDSQVSPKLKEMLSELKGRSSNEVKQGLRMALDFGARYALASGFVMNVLHYEWERLGGKVSDPTPWRDEVEDA